MERDLILDTLEKMGGNRTHAAKRLGISIRTMRNKLKEYRSTGLLDGEGDEEESLEEEVDKFFPAVAQSRS